MDSLIDYIGLRVIGAKEPESGMYVNDLPLVWQDQLNNPTDPDQAQFIQIWGNVQKRAAKIFETAFVNAMNRRYRLKKITEAIQLKSTVDTTNITPFEVGSLRGMLLDCYYLKSPFHYIPISQIHIYLNEEVSNLPVSIYEVSDNRLKLLKSYVINGVKGWNDVEVNEKYADSAMLFIAYDASIVNSVSLMQDDQDLDGRFWASYEWFWSHIYVQGAEYKNNAFKEGANSFGVNVTIGLQCSWEVLIANYKRELAVAWWYLLGAELMLERIYTDRIDKFIIGDLVRVKDVRSQLRDDFVKELLTFTDSIQIGRDWCIESETKTEKNEI